MSLCEFLLVGGILLDAGDDVDRGKLVAAGAWFMHETREEFNARMALALRVMNPADRFKSKLIAEKKYVDFLWLHGPIEKDKLHLFGCVP